MKSRTYLVTFLTMIFFQNLNSQKNVSDAEFKDFLSRDGLSFMMPKEFHEDMEVKHFRINFGAAFDPVYQIKSKDSNILLNYVLVTYAQRDEDVIRKTFPNKNINLKTNYLNILNNIDSWNYGRQTDTSFIKKQIKYFNAKTNKRLGADLSGEYLIKLEKPYKEDYNYLSIRFMTKYYRIYVYTFIFYKIIDDEIIKSNINRTLYSLKIK